MMFDPFISLINDPLLFNYVQENLKLFYLFGFKIIKSSFNLSEDQRRQQDFLPSSTKLHSSTTSKDSKNYKFNF